MATFLAMNRAKVIRGERLREQWRNGLGKLGFGDEALCSSAIQEKHHSKHPREQTSKYKGRLCLEH
jgi:hypothetical protein